MKIRRGDTVFIMRGKDRGKHGKVVRALPRERKIVVEGVALRKKHVRPRRAGQKGQVVEMPAAIPVSNARLECPKCKQRVRVGYVKTAKTKARICKNCEAQI